MLGCKIRLLAATMSAFVLGILSAEAADVNVVYGCCTPPPECKADGCAVEQAGVTVVYGVRPVAYVPPRPAEPHYVVDQGPSYVPPVLPYYDDYDYPYVPVYGYPGYRPLGPSHKPFGDRRFRRRGHDEKSSPFHGRRPDFHPSARVVQAAPPPQVGIGAIQPRSPVHVRARARASGRLGHR
jgi:hypothetical protein